MTGTAHSDEERRRRLAAQLRANLHRRKARARAEGETPPGTDQRENERPNE